MSQFNFQMWFLRCWQPWQCATHIVVFLGLIACEEIPKGSRPKEINPIKMQPPVTTAFHALQTLKKDMV